MRRAILLLEAADPRLLLERRRLLRGGVPAAGSREGVRARVAKEAHGLRPDLRDDVERELPDRVDAVEPGDEPGADLTHHATLVQSARGAEPVLRPEQA